ncbi:UDP-glycosyltransferase TURAN isoform X2 [Magnolia sinica]|uniref:UDP-glycosyltransferase TURAN isoform X2 n=1 Tax=Magnolia sinica TaxID=86752 RepID=UPI002659AAAB|nr:UDP-glycosyltransferase TURAN isoform X2 [Magnolia sinica]
MRTMASTSMTGQPGPLAAINSSPSMNSSYRVELGGRKSGSQYTSGRKREKVRERMGRRGRAAVVVLGDLGRSPRMQYHALSLSRQALLEVDVVAYGGTDPHGALLENASIHLHKMKPIVIRGLPRLLHLLVLPLKALVQFFVLLWFLCVKIPPPDVFIVQNPPSIPALIAVKFASWWRQSAFVVDWHNFGYTLLGLSLGRSNILVKIYHWAEKHFGMKADGALCVTKAMQHELAQNWGIKATVLYDQPPEFFHPASLQEKHELFCRLKGDLSNLCDIRDCISFGRDGNAAFQTEELNANNTLFTTQVGNDIFAKPSRPALIVSSTSWTADEDFSMLLEAAVMFDRRVAAILNEDDSVEEEMLWMDICKGKQYLYPRLLFIITGKGPEREKYEEQIKKLHLKRVAFRTMWLSAEDYPLLLGSADLGVCLHTSSSGLDLPMKVVDMFGCGLPVCAVSFSCIEELVKVEKNGLLFSSSSELADELLMLFKGFPDQCHALKSLRDGALETGSTSRWAAEWEDHALPLIDEVVLGKNKANVRGKTS